MTTASARRAAPAFARGRGVLVGTLILLAAVGWVVTGERMRGMDAGPGTDPGTLGFFLTAWVVMMAAMMFPSAAPMIATYDRVSRHRRAQGRRASRLGTLMFVAGYLLAWTGFGLAGYFVFELVTSLSIDALAWDKGGRYIAGGVLAAAAVYELTPLKDVCLRHCRGPVEFVLHHFRPNAVGALRAGAEHGAWCVGCCWALMCGLFALGVMSISWMVVIGVLIALEKMLPWRRIAVSAAAILLLALGAGVAFAPDNVPGLTIPGSAAMMQDGAMHGEGGASEGAAMPMQDR